MAEVYAIIVVLEIVRISKSAIICKKQTVIDAFAVEITRAVMRTVESIFSGVIFKVANSF
jgi:hypothetical protein